MTRLMYDAVTPENIPWDAPMVAGYVDPGGLFTWRDDQWALFPNAVKIRIAGWASTNDGHVLDVEAGDATPGQAPGWVRMRRDAGMWPTVYCSWAVWGDVRAAFIEQGVTEPEYWIAAYPGIGPRLYEGSLAHQYVDVGPYDLSVVADFWPGVDSLGPTPKPPAPTDEDEDMQILFSPSFPEGSIAIAVQGNTVLKEWRADNAGTYNGIPIAFGDWNRVPGRSFVPKFIDADMMVELLTPLQSAPGAPAPPAPPIDAKQLAADIAGHLTLAAK